MTNHQRKIFGIIASAWLVDQIDVALLTFLLGSLIKEFGLSSEQAGLLAAMTFLGQLVGNLIAGTSSDMFGRKMVFQATMVVWGLASLCAAISWSVSSLMFFRFLIGVGCRRRGAGRASDGVRVRACQRARQVDRDHGGILGGRLRVVGRDQLLPAALSRLGDGFSSQSGLLSA